VRKPQHKLARALANEGAGSIGAFNQLAEEGSCRKSSKVSGAAEASARISGSTALGEPQSSGHALGHLQTVAVLPAVPASAGSTEWRQAQGIDASCDLRFPRPNVWAGASDRQFGGTQTGSVPSGSRCRSHRSSSALRVCFSALFAMHGLTRLCTSARGRSGRRAPPQEPFCLSRAGQGDSKALQMSK
jgi:hypothetical protein